MGFSGWQGRRGRGLGFKAKGFGFRAARGRCHRFSVVAVIFLAGSVSTAMTVNLSSVVAR